MQQHMPLKLIAAGKRFSTGLALRERSDAHPTKTAYTKFETAFASKECTIFVPRT